MPSSSTVLADVLCTEWKMACINWARSVTESETDIAARGRPDVVSKRITFFLKT